MPAAQPVDTLLHLCYKIFTYLLNNWGLVPTLWPQGDGLAGDQEFVADVSAQPGEGRAQIREGLGGGTGTPKQIGFSAPPSVVCGLPSTARCK